MVGTGTGQGGVECSFRDWEQRSEEEREEGAWSCGAEGQVGNQMGPRTTPRNRRLNVTFLPHCELLWTLARLAIKQALACLLALIVMTFTASFSSSRLIMSSVMLPVHPMSWAIFVSRNRAALHLSW